MFKDLQEFETHWTVKFKLKQKGNQGKNYIQYFFFKLMHGLIEHEKVGS